MKNTIKEKFSDVIPYVMILLSVVVAAFIVMTHTVTGLSTAVKPQDFAQKSVKFQKGYSDGYDAMHEHLNRVKSDYELGYNLGEDVAYDEHIRNMKSKHVS